MPQPGDGAFRNYGRRLPLLVGAVVLVAIAAAFFVFDASTGERGDGGSLIRSVLSAATLVLGFGWVLLGNALRARFQHLRTERLAERHPGAVVADVVPSGDFWDAFYALASNPPGGAPTWAFSFSNDSVLSVLADSTGISLWNGSRARPYRHVFVPWQRVHDVQPANIAVDVRRSRGLVIVVGDGPKRIELPLTISGFGWSRRVGPTESELLAMHARIEELRHSSAPGETD